MGTLGTSLPDQGTQVAVCRRTGRTGSALSRTDFGDYPIISTRLAVSPPRQPIADIPGGSECVVNVEERFFWQPLEWQ